MIPSDLIEQLRQVALFALTLPGVQLIVGGAFLNFALAVAAALRHGDLNLAELGAFLSRDILPKVITYYAFHIAGDALDAAWVPAAVLALIAANLGARALAHLAELGVPIPDGAVRLAVGARDRLPTRADQRPDVSTPPAA